MLKCIFLKTAALVTATFIQSTMAISAEAPDICDRTFAYDTLERGDYNGFCGCEKITKSFIRVLQRAPDFASILSETATSCSPLNDILTDPITASAGGAGSSDDGRPDPERGSSSPPSRGGSTPGGGGSPSNGGGGGTPSGGGGGGVYNGW